MSSYSYEELARSGLGIGLDPISGIIGGVAQLATAGVTAYQTYAAENFKKKELSQKQAEVQAMLAQRQREAELEAQQAQRAAELEAQQAPWKARNVQIGLGAGALVAAIGFTAWALRRGRS